MNTKYFLAISILTMFGHVSVSNASCSTTGPNDPRYKMANAPLEKNVSFDTVIVQKDAPVGTVLATVETTPTNLLFAYCASGTQGYAYFNMTYGGAVSGNLTYVYKTNVPGVGIQALYAKQYTYAFMNPGQSLRTTSETAYSDGNPTTVSLIKIGPVTSGALNGGQIGYVSLDGYSAFTPYTINLDGGTNIKAIACTIKNPNIAIRLEDILGADLNAVGTTAKLKKFDIGLDCEADAKINVQLTGNKNTDTSTAGVLQLTNAGATGVAKGVGIQMLYNDAPMTLNQNVLLKTSTGGLETFEFGAQYYQTKAAVSTGSANTTATLEITYQ